MKMKILTCPQCKSKNLACGVLTKNTAIGKSRSWNVECKDCSYRIDSLEKTNTKKNAIASWNKTVSEILILSYLGEGRSTSLTFNGKTDIREFIEACGFSERRLRVDLNNLARKHRLDKVILTDLGSEASSVKKVYPSYKISSYGKVCLEKVKRYNGVREIYHSPSRKPRCLHTGMN